MHEEEFSMRGCYNPYFDGPRTNYRLNDTIERFIAAYDGTAIGHDVRNMWENGISYEAICDRMGIGYDDYAEE